MYYHGVDSVTGFVLAGGKSSRMGQDKAFMQLGGRTLLAHALERVQAATGNTWIVGSTEKFAAFGPVVEDVYPGRGPLAGQIDFLKYLITQARACHAAVVVPRAGGGLQPLCAVYRKDFAQVAQRSLTAGKNKIDTLFSDVPTLVIEQAELERSGFMQDMFRNLNTEQDWQEAQQKLVPE